MINVTATLDLTVGRWLNEPGDFERTADTLRFTTSPSSDFWRTTHYGFVRDSGHCLGVEVEGPFTATVRVRGEYRNTYDQAGLMIRIDKSNWLKCGIEYVEGEALLSVVATNVTSDWSVISTAMPEWLRVRLTRDDDFVTVEFAPDGAEWSLARIAHLKPSAKVWIGPMACSPGGHGFAAEFADFAIAVEEVESAE